MKGTEKIIAHIRADADAQAAAIRAQSEQQCAGVRESYDKQAQELYRGFGQALEKCSGWQLYLLSSHTEFERCFGKPADKKRKLYNGMIKCDLYMYR